MIDLLPDLQGLTLLISILGLLREVLSAVDAVVLLVCCLWSVSWQFRIVGLGEHYKTFC